MLDWSGLLTPYAPPRQVAPNNAIGEMAQSVTQNAQFQQQQQAAAAEAQRKNQLALAQLSQEDRQKLADQALQHMHVEGVNKYYDQQAELHKEQLAEKEQARKDKAIESLRLAFRAAVKRGTSGRSERDQIRSQMASLGYNIGEEDTDLPAPAASVMPAEAVGVPSAAAATVKRAKAPSKKFAGQLGAYMASPEATAPSGQSGEQVDEEAGASIPQPGVLPPEITGMGAEVQGTKQPMEQKTASRGGRYTITDPAGIPIDSYDEPLQRSKERANIEAAMAPLIGNPRNEHEKMAAQKAADHAMAMSEQVPFEQAIKSGLGIYQAEMSQFKKEGPGGHGGGSGGLGPKGEYTRDKDVETLTMNIIKSETTAKKVANLEEMDRALSEAEGMLKEGGRFGHNAGLLAVTKAFNGRAAAQKEFAALQTSQSYWGELEQYLNKFKPDAPISSEMLTHMAKAIDITRKELEQRRREYAEDIRKDVTASAIPFRDQKQREAQADRAANQLSRHRGTPTPEASGTPDSDLELVRRYKAGKK